MNAVVLEPLLGTNGNLAVEAVSTCIDGSAQTTLENFDSRSSCRLTMTKTRDFRGSLAEGCLTR
jgi:hypothetical protein